MERRFVLCPVVLLLILSASAKDKNKGVLSAEVLRAQTVSVVINPEAGEPLTDPSANRRAQEDVENALSKWGRFRIVLEARTADLVIAVRKGTPRGATPTIRGGAIDDRPVIVQSGGDGDIRIGAQRGRPPKVTEPGIGMPQDTGPRLGTEVGPSEDTMQVYRGGVQYPLDSAPVWRYAARNALRAPVVPGVEQFKKAITESEKPWPRSKGRESRSCLAEECSSCGGLKVV